MLFTQALLVTLVGIIATIDYNGPLFMIHRPLVTSAMVGLVLGDFTQGVLIGSALELTWLGVTGIGGYTPPDTISGARRNCWYRYSGSNCSCYPTVGCSCKNFRCLFCEKS